MIRVGIIDDQKDILEYLAGAIKLHYRDMVYISAISSAEEYEYEAEYGNINDYDILLIDIVLGENSGIDMAQKYLNRDSRTKVIFMTGFVDYSPEIFKANPAGLLHKPIVEEKLFETLDRVIEEHNNEEKSFITLESKDKIYNIAVNKIIYAESNGRRLIIHQETDTIIINMKMDDLEKMLMSGDNSQAFIRCHQSYIVNARYVRSFGNRAIALNSKEEIPVSQNRQAAAKEKFLSYLGSCL